MDNSLIISADKFYKFIQEGIIPLGPYIVEEEVNLYGHDDDRKANIKINEVIDLGQGVFKNSFSLFDFDFSKDFKFGSARFLDNVNINCNFQELVEFDDSFFEKGLYLSGSKFKETVYMNNSSFNILFFTKCLLEGGLNLDNCYINRLHLGDSIIRKYLNAGFAKISRIDFDESNIEYFIVGRNPAIGWLYEKKLNRIKFSIEDACEMCGHSKPSYGWHKIEDEVMERKFYRWKFFERN